MDTLEGKREPGSIVYVHQNGELQFKQGYRVTEYERTEPEKGVFILKEIVSYRFTPTGDSLHPDRLVKFVPNSIPFYSSTS